MQCEGALERNCACCIVEAQGTGQRKGDNLWRICTPVAFVMPLAASNTTVHELLAPRAGAYSCHWAGLCEVDRQSAR